MHGWAQDFRYSFRQLKKAPGFAITAVLSLALGIGATTAVFSVVYGVLLNPYPYRDSSRLVHIFLLDKADEKNWPNLTGAQFRQLRELPIIDSLAGWESWNLSTTGGDIPEDVNATYFTSNAFPHFGVPVMMGRPITTADAKEGQDPEPVTVLSYQFWRRHYNGDRNVLGQSIQLNRKTYTIIGVAAPRFTWNDGDVYLPFKLTNDQTRALAINTRLKPGVSFEAANAQLQPLFQQFAKENPARFPPAFRVRVEGLNDQFVERIGGTLFLLFGSVVLLLAIGCGNVSILLLARGTARQHELGVRAAIGASRARLVRQLLTESSLLALCGAGLGVLLAFETVALIARWLPEFSFPHEASMQINIPVLIFSVAIAVLTALVFGLSPALEFSRPEVSQLIAGGRRTTTGSRTRRTHFALIGTQIALTVLLLSGAGAATRGFLKLMHVNLGYDPTNTMSVGIPIHDNSYKTWEERAAYFEELQRSVKSTPGVTDIAISTNATPPLNGWEQPVEREGTNVAQQLRSRVNFVNPAYFSLLKIPLLRGRLWDNPENQRAARVAVINQTMAHQYWPNMDAIGKRLRMPDLHHEEPYFIGRPKGDDWLEVIGIVADARNDGLSKAPKPAVYVPYTTAMPMFTQLLVRTEGPPLALLNSVRSQIRLVNPDQQAVRDVRTLPELVTAVQEWQQEHLVSNLFAAFSVLALLLAAVGLYSVVSYSVAQRTNEIGIRMALGALAKDILGLVFRSVASSVLAGLVAGLLLSIILDGVLSRWAQVRSRDPLILGGVVALMVLSAMLACLIPARRATAVDPMKALRCD